jgi:hypothetical protein
MNLISLVFENFLEVCAILIRLSTDINFTTWNMILIKWDLSLFLKAIYFYYNITLVSVDYSIDSFWTRQEICISITVDDYPLWDLSNPCYCWFGYSHCNRPLQSLCLWKPLTSSDFHLTMPRRETWSQKPCLHSVHFERINHYTCRFTCCWYLSWRLGCDSCLSWFLGRTYSF